MLTPKDEGTCSSFKLLFIIIFWIFPTTFGPLDASIAFGGQDAPK
jgi:hypothetical protein